jgi:ribosomal protein S18 acetylase RimI-like enzyme
MRIRRATEQDAAAISRMVVPLVERFIARTLEPSAALRLLNSMTAEAMAGYLTGPYRYHVAEDREGLLGVVGMRDDRHLYHLFVSERAQGRGLGSCLWQVARQACIEAGGDGDFTVNASRNAVGFYRKQGFEVEKTVVRDGVVSVAMVLRPATSDNRTAPG